MNIVTAVTFEKSLAALINDGIILVEYTQKMPAGYIYTTMQQRMSTHYANSQPHHNPQHIQPMMQPGGYSNNYNQQHAQPAQSQMHTPPGSFFNQHQDIPVDFKALLSRMLENVDTLYRVIAENMDGLVYPEYESELSKLSKRIFDIEEQLKGDSAPAEEYNNAPETHINTWEYACHKFINAMGLFMPVEIDKLMAGLLLVLVPTPELNSFLSYLAEKCTIGLGGVTSVTISHGVYSDVLNMPGVYKYDDTNQHVAISDVVDGNVYVMTFNPQTHTIYDAYTVHPEVDNHHVVSRATNADVISKIFFPVSENDVDSPASYDNAMDTLTAWHEDKSVKVPGPYQNILNLDNMQDRIVTMRRGIKTLTEPKKALRVVLEKIGNVDWTVPGAEIDVADDEMELLFHSNAVYSMPNHIRVVVILGEDRVVIASYDRRDYVIRDIYSTYLNVKTGFNGLSRSSQPDRDLLFLLTLGEKS